MMAGAGALRVHFVPDSSDRVWLRTESKVFPLVYVLGPVDILESPLPLQGSEGSVLGAWELRCKKSSFRCGYGIAGWTVW